MTVEQFKEKVEEFVNDCCGEYFYVKETRIEYDEDPDYPRATIHLVIYGYWDEDGDSMHFEIPLYVSEWDKREIAIDIDDAGELFADSTGLYCYLWHETMSRLEKAADKRK